MGCEFASIFSKFGSKVTIVELLPTILSMEDKQVMRVIQKSFKESGIEVMTDASVENIAITESGVKTVLKDGREFVTEKSLSPSEGVLIPQA